MKEGSFVVVFPSIFAKNKQNVLVGNIKKVLKNQGQQFGQILKDDNLIVVDANDPVFASSAINLLFGVEKVSIARRIENKFDVTVSSIAKIGASLLLRGDEFFVKVEGQSSGYLPKDIEVAATAALIDKVADMSCRPGTEVKHDKLIHCFLTKKNAYISIFIDKGHGGVPYNSQDQKMVCCVYDELSAVSCLESIKQGFDVKILVCYHNEANLLELVKIINRIIPRVLSPKVNLDFFAIPVKQDVAKTLQLRIKAVVEISCLVAKRDGIQRVSLPLSPLVFPMWFVEQNARIISKNKLTSWMPLSGIDDEIINTAKEIGLGKYLHRIEKLLLIRLAKPEPDASEVVTKALKSGQTITVKVGPNNIHDILDTLKH